MGRIRRPDASPVGFAVLAFACLALVFGALGLGRALLAGAPAEPRFVPQGGGGLAGRPNVVMIHLESTGAGATGVYNPEMETTPFLDELAGDSLVAERAYTTIPHTGKAMVSANCGIEPPPHTLSSEADADALPVPCLSELLRERGYRGVYFQTAKAASPPQVPGGGSYRMQNLGLRGTMYPRDWMPTRGFEEANYFAYEDASMLGPSRRWLEAHAERAGGAPFLASYQTTTPHHPYYAPDRYGSRGYVADAEQNRYLNSVRYLDAFVERLIGQYKEMGLYEETIFVIYADHGEAFGEHEVAGREVRQHDGILYEEGARVPLMIHAPGADRARGRVSRLSSIMDILPTVADLAGYRISEASRYTGESLLSPRSPGGRTLYLSCWPPGRCAGAVNSAGEKYIHRFGRAPDEYYDLSSDPRERDNLLESAGEHPRARLLYDQTAEWFSAVVRRYEDAA